MYASMAIVFREGLEMAIIISLLLAATKDINKGAFWILGGTVLGVLLASMLGYFALNNEAIIAVMKAKVTGGVILFVSALFIGYTVIWMKENGRKISQDIKQSTSELPANPLFSLALVALFCVLREGVEVVIFLMGLVTSGGVSNVDVLAGTVLGSLGAIVAGAAMYFGLVRINLGKVFNVFAVLMSFLSAGMMVNAVSKFTSAGLLNPIVSQVWDSSALLVHHTSWIALFMHVMAGYTEKPSLLQLIAYVLALTILYLLTKRNNNEFQNKIVK